MQNGSDKCTYVLTVLADIMEYLDVMECSVYVSLRLVCCDIISYF